MEEMTETFIWMVNVNFTLLYNFFVHNHSFGVEIFLIKKQNFLIEYFVPISCLLPISQVSF